MLWLRIEVPVEAAARAAQCDASHELAVSITAAAHDVVVQPGPFTLQGERRRASAQAAGAPGRQEA
eukprot:3565814-Lingulodinium_polyedra.AAC.1